jgi:hypothetical protein
VTMEHLRPVAVTASTNIIDIRGVWVLDPEKRDLSICLCLQRSTILRRLYFYARSFSNGLEACPAIMYCFQAIQNLGMQVNTPAVIWFPITEVDGSIVLESTTSMILSMSAVHL